MSNRTIEDLYTEEKMFEDIEIGEEFLAEGRRWVKVNEENAALVWEEGDSKVIH